MLRRSCWISTVTLVAAPLALEFWERLRDEVRYDSMGDLVGAIADDVERTREIVPVAEPGG